MLNSRRSKIWIFFFFNGLILHCLFDQFWFPTYFKKLLMLKCVKNKFKNAFMIWIHSISLIFFFNMITTCVKALWGIKLGYQKLLCSNLGSDLPPWSLRVLLELVQVSPVSVNGWMFVCVHCDGLVTQVQASFAPLNGMDCTDLPRVTKDNVMVQWNVGFGQFYALWVKKKN